MLKEQMNNNEVKYVVFSPSCMNMFVFMFTVCQSYELGPNKYRGNAGYLQVTRAKADNPLHRAFLEAGVQAGYLSTDDFCGAQLEGFGIYDRTISKGTRAR